jgi:hypothetical protein
MERQLIDTKTRPVLDEARTLQIQTKILEEMKDKVDLKEVKIFCFICLMVFNANRLMGSQCSPLDNWI